MCGEGGGREDGGVCAEDSMLCKICFIREEKINFHLIRSSVM